MRHQTTFDNPDELKKWLNIGVSLGKNDEQADSENRKLIAFLKGYDEAELSAIESFASHKLPLSEELLGYTEPVIRLLLIKKFIDVNNPYIIGEFFKYGAMSGQLIVKRLFFELVELHFTRSDYFENIFSYCIFRKRGSPTTWMKLSDSLTEEEIIKKIDEQVSRLLWRLRKSLNKPRRLRISQTSGDWRIYLIEKPIGTKVITSVGNNVEVPAASFSILVADLKNKKVGYISGSNKEIFEVQNFIRRKVFPEQVFIPRNDKHIESEDLFKSLLLEGVETNLEIVGVTIKQAELPGSPFLKVKSTDNTSISPALLELQKFTENTDISNVGNIDYKLDENTLSLYSFGDEWERRRINIASRGKLHSLEERVLTEIGEILNCDIKETRFITKELSNEEIASRLLTMKHIAAEVPKKVDSLIIRLVKNKLIRKPKKISKRRCSDWGCAGTSWEKEECPICGREMIIIGENISISTVESSITLALSKLLGSSLNDYDLVRHRVARNKHSKTVIRFVRGSSDVAIYVAIVNSKKDVNFCKLLAEEGYGVLAVLDPKLKNRKDELSSAGCETTDLASTLVGIVDVIDDPNNLSLKVQFLTALETLEQAFLKQIYDLLQRSVNRLENKPANYNEEFFEIDLKNIIQALVPNVVRLGTQFKGKSVPDGYCSFKESSQSKNSLFGWDAKYSYSQAYSLGSSDLKKQSSYIKWLVNNPEPKSLGKLRIYSFISNFEDMRGFKTVLTNLRKSKDKPWRCRIILIQDRLLVELGKWMMKNPKKIIDNGPEISHTFFKWINSSKRKMIDRWIICSVDDWEALHSELEGL